jgi:hypothetical protein
LGLGGRVAHVFYDGWLGVKLGRCDWRSGSGLTKNRDRV